MNLLDSGFGNINHIEEDKSKVALVTLYPPGIGHVRRNLVRSTHNLGRRALSVESINLSIGQRIGVVV